MIVMSKKESHSNMSIKKCDL